MRLDWVHKDSLHRKFGDVRRQGGREALRRARMAHLSAWYFGVCAGEFLRGPRLIDAIKLE
jgi:hypothetical protein